MDEKMMNQLIKLAVKNAQWINEAYDNNNTVKISYSIGYLDCIMNVLNINSNSKWYTYETDSNYEKITCIKITELAINDKETDKVETIKI